MGDEKHEQIRSEGSNEAEQHVRYITEQQLEEALEKQRKSGRSIWEILMSDLSLKSIKDLLTYELRPRGESLDKAIVRNGHATEEELDRIVGQEGSEDELRLGDILVDKRIITRAQLGKALIEQERTGHPLGRVLLNLGYVNAKQLSDAQRLEQPAETAQLRSEKIYEAVQESELLSEEKLRELAKEAQQSGRDLAEILVEQGHVTSHKLGEILEQKFNVPYVNLARYDIDRETINILPENMIRSRRAVPVKVEAGYLYVAMADPEDVTAIDDISMISGYRVKPMLTWDKQIQAAISEIFGPGESPAAPETETTAGRQGESQAPAERTEQRMEELVENVSVVNLVGSVVEGAINADATDVHLEPQEEHIRVRYRIDGVLYDVMTIPKAVEAALISRVKILANMDITERRLPQDGHYSMNIDGDTYNMRIATLPTSQGERLVIRLLNPQNIFLGLKQLGLSSEDFEKVESLIYQPHGMFLATGPIGAGKTTTLYAAVNRVNVLSDSIVTIEDPIEYELPGVNQVQVEPKAQRTFSNTLRSMLRQDVDTMLVGEIRDTETATIATRAAITGHSLFTSMHTRDTASTVTSLINLGISPFLVSSALTGIINQRLVRRVCKQCYEEYEPESHLLEELGVPGDNPENITFVRGNGCSACYHTGYKGRVGVFEILPVTERIKELIMDNASEVQLKHVAQEEGMTSLEEDAVSKLKQHITSAEDVIRTIITNP